MEILPQRTIRVRSLKDWQRLWIFGDCHLGNASCVEHLVDETLEEIRTDKSALMVGIGDYADCISMYDPRFDAHEVSPGHRADYFEKQGHAIAQMLVKKFWPIRNKILFLLRGNHEDKYETLMDQAIMRTVCDKLKSPYGEYCASMVLAFTDGRKTERFRLWAHHGAGFASTTGGKINKLKSVFSIHQSDIYMCGHSHEQMDLPKVRLYDKDGHIEQQKMLAVMTGAFLATYRQGQSTYGEKRMYEPVALGAVAVRIRPEGRKLAVEKY